MCVCVCVFVHLFVCLPLVVLQGLAGSGYNSAGLVTAQRLYCVALWLYCLYNVYLHCIDVCLYYVVLNACVCVSARSTRTASTSTQFKGRLADILSAVCLVWLWFPGAPSWGMCAAVSGQSRLRFVPRCITKRLLLSFPQAVFTVMEFHL